MSIEPVANEKSVSLLNEIEAEASMLQTGLEVRSSQWVVRHWRLLAKAVRELRKEWTV